MVNPMFIPWAVVLAMLFTGVAHWMHEKRIHRVRYLVFGPRGSAASWCRFVGPLRVLSAGLVTWGLLVLLSLSESQWDQDSSEGQKPIHHVVIGLDVSPSMRIKDAGASRKQMRSDRAREVLESVLARIDNRRVQVSVIAFYTEARPVVVDTFDPAVVHNIMNDLPLGQAFRAGKTNVYSVITASETLSNTWRRGSATMIIVSDGDTLPAETIPKRPAAFDRILVLGVGDPFRGTFIHDHVSRQDRRSLAQLASRIRGEYLDINTNHIATELLPSGPLWSDGNDTFARRTLAIAAVMLGSACLAFLPIALAIAGGAFEAGRQPAGRLTRQQFDQEPAWNVQ